MKYKFFLNLNFLLLSFVFLTAHHYKGLPHYNYFANYPQVPIEEFLGQAGKYEFSLMIYDFQGMTMKDVQQPDDVRLYLIAYNLKTNKAYKGSLKVDIMDGEKIVLTENFKKSEEESLYVFREKLSEEGDYSLNITLLEENNLKANVPFLLSSQKINWALWILLSLAVLMVIAAIGSRKARILKDRKLSRINNKLGSV